MSFIIGNNTHQQDQSVSPSGTIDVTIENFVQDVVHASKEKLVIVDFWAPWCGPCKQLLPILERLVGQFSKNARLVKVNVDENKEIAMQMQIQSVPTVFAFKNGQPVDAFAGSLPESKIREFIIKNLGDAGQDLLLEEVENKAKNCFHDGDLNAAYSLYNQLINHDPQNLAYLSEIIKCEIFLGQLEEAEQKLKVFPQNESSFTCLKDCFDLCKEAQHKKNITDNENLDLNDYFDLSLVCFSKMDFQKSFDTLLSLIKEDKEWENGKAKERLIVFLNILGNDHPLTKETRKKLSSLLFS